jgi:hypothetical protein
MTVHYTSQCISRIAATVSNMKNIWIGRKIMPRSLYVYIFIGHILITDLICFVFVWWCLTPLSTIFQLYRGGQFYGWKKLDDPEKTTNQSVDVLHPSQELRHVFTLTGYIPSQELPHVFMLVERRFEVLSVWHYPFIYSLAT